MAEAASACVRLPMTDANTVGASPTERRFPPPTVFPARSQHALYRTAKADPGAPSLRRTAGVVVGDVEAAQQGFHAVRACSGRRRSRRQQCSSRCSAASPSDTSARNRLAQPVSAGSGKTNRSPAASAISGTLEGRITMDDQTYRAQGWTISATSGQTTFTNDRSGHGMVVSTAEVQPF